jgi:hypothetical protein
MRTKTDESATEGTKELGSLLGTKPAHATRLCDGGILHNPLGLHFTNSRQRANEIKGPHLRHALFAGSESEEIGERQLTHFDHPLNFGATATIRYGQL